jgi:hypothetical protein
MRDRISATLKISIAAGAALLIVACSSGGDTANTAVTNDLDSNMMLDVPANDASAMESTANATDTTPVANETEDSGASEGGQTSGNSADGNDVAGM